MNKRDYYEILNVSKNASDHDIKSAYRKLALQYHPDRNPGDRLAEERFKEASEAYEILSNSEKRARYDRFGHQGVSGQGFQDVSDIFQSFGSIFEEFFGFSGASGGGRSRRGADLRYDLAIEFEEAVFGAEKEIEFEKAVMCETCEGGGAKPGTGRVTCRTCGGSGQIRRSQGFFSIATPCGTCGGAGSRLETPCGTCKGEGRVIRNKKISVKIPAGVDTGVRMRIGGEGEPGLLGGSAGDLYVVLHVKESDRFTRDELDLILLQPIGMAQAALGCKLKIKTLDGEEVIEVPPGSQHGHRITVAGAGVPQLKGKSRGDLHVELQIVIPQKLTREQKDILHKYADISNEKVLQQEEAGFFQKIFRD